jgi:hypothetical protein
MPDTENRKNFKQNQTATPKKQYTKHQAIEKHKSQN